jgi:hypothetical protein
MKVEKESDADTWEFYQVAEVEWWWRRIAPAGTIIRTSAKGHEDMHECLCNARRNGWDGNYVSSSDNVSVKNKSSIKGELK